ncbi:MAG TPA: KGG domain-containing protein [Flavipsychrobacter sp.]|nr:KGG domain-containing protein [Flavipsychrobacter sp.]
MEQNNNWDGQQSPNNQHIRTSSPRGNTSKRGFASMDENLQRDIARKGGKEAHHKGVAHEWTSEEAAAAGRKGGQVTQSNRNNQKNKARDLDDQMANE